MFVQLVARPRGLSGQLTFLEIGFFLLQITGTHSFLPNLRLQTGGPVLTSSHTPWTKGLWGHPQEVGLLPRINPATASSQEKPPSGSFRFGTSRASLLTVPLIEGPALMSNKLDRSAE